MAQVFQVNGVNYSYIMQADWQDELDSQGLDGNSAVLRFRRLTLSTDIMTAAEFNTLSALEGTRVSVTCPPYNDRNAAYKTYYVCYLESATGRHESINLANVTLELLVLV